MNYFKNSLEEIKKVTWPTRNRAVSITIITIIFTLVSTLILSFFDFGFRKGYDYLTDLGLKIQSESSVKSEVKPDVNVKDLVKAKPVTSDIKASSGKSEESKAEPAKDKK